MWESAFGRDLFFLVVFGDVDDLVLEDEKIGSIVACNPNHILVVVLNPAAHHFPIGEFEADDLLFFAE